ncbi:MAG: hypothetical protein KDA37_04470 [Planctomycetales bacterium]|nr:hypothetical protein [Planctomycetales bacterium]
MTFTEQINDFTAFAKKLAEDQGEGFSVRAALDLWESRDSDARAIQQAIDSYEADERGRPADDFLAERRAARTSGNP